MDPLWFESLLCWCILCIVFTSPLILIETQIVLIWRYRMIAVKSILAIYLIVLLVSMAEPRLLEPILVVALSTCSFLRLCISLRQKGKSSKERLFLRAYQLILLLLSLSSGLFYVTLDFRILTGTV